MQCIYLGITLIQLAVFFDAALKSISDIKSASYTHVLWMQVFGTLKKNVFLLIYDTWFYFQLLGIQSEQYEYSCLAGKHPQ